MLSAFLTGFFLGLSLIVAIGAQNAFVLRQGILGQHIFFIALFCSIADTFLIVLGIIGASYFLNDLVREHSNLIFGLAALWLFTYGLLRMISLFKSDYVIVTNNSKPFNLVNAITIVSIFTFANPHVYLDTMILIGSISQKYIGIDRIFFGMGASVASFIWFFSLAYGARTISPIIQKPNHWRIIDTVIALIMFSIAINLALQGGWL
jgi:L-lysine exporter family protein LysE/ArgO